MKNKIVKELVIKQVNRDANLIDRILLVRNNDKCYILDKDAKILAMLGLSLYVDNEVKYIPYKDSSNVLGILITNGFPAAMIHI